MIQSPTSPPDMPTPSIMKGLEFSSTMRGSVNRGGHDGQDKLHKEVVVNKCFAPQVGTSQPSYQHKHLGVSFAKIHTSHRPVSIRIIVGVAAHI